MTERVVPKPEAQPDHRKPTSRLKKAVAIGTAVAAGVVTTIVGVGAAIRGGEEGTGERPGGNSQGVGEIPGTIEGEDLFSITAQEVCDRFISSQEVMEAARQAVGSDDISCILSMNNVSGGDTKPDSNLIILSRAEQGDRYEGTAIVVGISQSGTIQRLFDGGYYLPDRAKNVDVNGDELPGGALFDPGTGELLMQEDEVDVTVRYASLALSADGCPPELAAFGAALQNAIR